MFRVAMRRLVAACLVLLCLLASNVWLLELCAHPLETPDCCRDGMCPFHHSNGDNCVCHLSPRNDQLMMISLAPPAIMQAVSGATVIPMMGVADDSASNPTSFDQITLTPPPKA